MIRESQSKVAPTRQLQTSLTDAHRRGRALGATLRPQIEASWDGYVRLFAATGASGSQIRELGLEAADTIAGWAPQLLEEVAGTADGAGLEAWQLAALNARTELLAAFSGSPSPGRGECSTAVFLAADGSAPRTIQTWDWYDHLRDVKLAWRLEPAPGKRVTTFTEVGVVGKIGVNQSGLGIHFNLLRHQRDGQRVGVPVHVIARRILDEATTVAEAEEIARSARPGASSVITVVSYDGGRSDAASIEISPVGVKVLRPGPERSLLHTNHFLDPELAMGERLGSDDSDTYARQLELIRRSGKLNTAAPGSRAAALVCHRDDGAALCCHPDDEAPFDAQWRTHLVICLDLLNRRLRYYDGEPCTATDSSWQSL